MSKVETAKKMIENHNSLVEQVDKLRDLISEEEKRLLPKIKEKIDQMIPVEQINFYDSLNDSQLKYELFLYLRKKGE